MGQIVKRKRKGRPSNTDRARRNSSAGPPSPVNRRMSNRRRNFRYNFDIDDYVDDDEFYDGEDEEVGRREKKLRLLLREDESRSNRRVTNAPTSSSSADDEDYDGNPSKKRKIDGCDGEDDEDIEIEEVRDRKFEEEEEDEEEGEGEEAAAGGSDFVCGAAPDLSRGVPLPDKKTLELIVDKLQKKDIYGVYAEPVDPEELPDYHDVIKHPMDFATMRKKLAKGLYLTLKEFESDVLLICTNAMQYNAPDTVYYKQASSIQEQAKLRFQRLRANVDRSEIEPKSELKTTPSFSLPRKQLKKSVVGIAQDPAVSETFSGANVRTGEFLKFSSAQTPDRPTNGEVLIAESSSLADNNLDKEQELLQGKGITSKLGRKPSVHDENRRATYNISVQPVTESSSVFSTFEGESKQFISVGLHADHSYTRSLARFAATLGSVAWKVASQTIKQSLPEGVKFGRGWVGEYEPLPTPVLLPGNHIFKESIFLSPFQISSDIIDNGKASRSSVDRKDLNPAFTGSNLLRPNTLSRNFMKPEMKGSPQVELNHPPPTHVRATDIPSPRAAKPVSGNRNFPSLASSMHPNNKNGGYASGRASNGKPTSVGLDSNQMVLMDNSLTCQQEGKPTLGSQDYNRKVPTGDNLAQLREQQGFSDPVQMMKMLAEKAHHQQNNSYGLGFGPKREDSNNGASTIPQFPLKVQHQQIYSNGSQIGSKRDDSTHVALTAAQAWMSLGGTAGGFIKPPLAENTNPLKQHIYADSLYNPAPDHQQHQVSRFRGEFPVPGIQFQADKNNYQQPVHAFVPQPVRTISEAHLQNRHVPADLSRFQVQPSWRGATPQMQKQSRPKQQESRPPDLNIGYQSVDSPVRQSTGMLVDSQQPDLALQL